MAINSINNGEALSSVRTKLNQAISGVNTLETDVDNLETDKVNKSGDTMTGGLYTNSANSTMVASNGTANQEFPNVFAASSTLRTAAFVGAGGAASVWWGVLEGGNQVAKGAIDSTSNGGGLTLWANNGSSWFNGIRLNGGSQSAGSVDLPLQPIISGQMGTAMTQPDGPQKLAFNQFWVSRGITYNSSTRRFTVPIAGVYRITMNPFKRNSASLFRVLIGVNTDTPTTSNHFGHTYANGSTYDTGCIDSIVNLSAGDFIVFYLQAGGLYNQSNDLFNQITIAKIA